VARLIFEAIGTCRGDTHPLCRREWRNIHVGRASRPPVWPIRVVRIRRVIGPGMSLRRRLERRCGGTAAAIEDLVYRIAEERLAAAPQRRAFYEDPAVWAYPVAHEIAADPLEALALGGRIGAWWVTDRGSGQKHEFVFADRLEFGLIDTVHYRAGGKKEGR
jgi:hypothetical protein